MSNYLIQQIAEYTGHIFSSAQSNDVLMYQTQNSNSIWIGPSNSTTPMQIKNDGSLVVTNITASGTITAKTINANTITTGSLPLAQGGTGATGVTGTGLNVLNSNAVFNVLSNIGTLSNAGAIYTSNIFSSYATVSNLTIPTSVTFPTNFSINTGTTGTLTTSNPSIIGGTHSNGTFNNGSFQGTLIGNATTAGTCTGNAATATTLVANPTLTGTVTAGTFSGLGTGITGLNQTNLAPGSFTGTGGIVCSNAPTFVGTVTANTFVGSLTGNAATATTSTTAGTCTGNAATATTLVANPTLTGTVTAGTFSGAHSGSGTGITGLNQTNLAPGSFTGTGGLVCSNAPTFVGTVTAGTFSGAHIGSGASLTNIPSTAIVLPTTNCTLSTPYNIVLTTGYSSAGTGPFTFNLGQYINLSGWYIPYSYYVSIYTYNTQVQAIYQINIAAPVSTVNYYIESSNCIRAVNAPYVLPCSMSGTILTLSNLPGQNGTIFIRPVY